MNVPALSSIQTASMLFGAWLPFAVVSVKLICIACACAIDVRPSTMAIVNARMIYIVDETRGARENNARGERQQSACRTRDPGGMLPRSESKANSTARNR